MPFDLIVAGISGIFGGGSLLLSYRQTLALSRPLILPLKKKTDAISFDKYWRAKSKEGEAAGSIIAGGHLKRQGQGPDPAPEKEPGKARARGSGSPCD